MDFEQPAVLSLVERMTNELQARATVLLHESGQILQRAGWVDDGEFPAMAALVAAMIAASKSLGGIGGEVSEPTRFGCDSEAMGLYTVSVGQGVWIAVIYDQPLNPGQLRMKVRRYAELLAGLGVKKPEQWELPEAVAPEGRKTTAAKEITRATVAPQDGGKPAHPEILTRNNSSLFGNITDEEIDQLFENARS